MTDDASGAPVGPGLAGAAREQAGRETSQPGGAGVVRPDVLLAGRDVAGREGMDAARPDEEAADPRGAVREGIVGARPGDEPADTVTAEREGMGIARPGAEAAAEGMSLEEAAAKGLRGLARLLAEKEPPRPVPAPLPSALPRLPPAMADASLGPLIGFLSVETAPEAPPAPPRDPARAAAFPPVWTWPGLHRPDEAALRHEGGVLSFGALDGLARDMAAALRARGVRRGDRVGYLGFNHPAQLVVLFALARLGAAMLPLNWRLAAEEQAWILRDAGVRLLVAPRSHRDAARGLAPEGVNAGDFVMDPTEPLPQRQAGITVGDASDPLLVVYTSGTTGRPKGAVLDGAAVAANARNAASVFGLTAEDHVLTVLPMFHVGGLNIQTLPALSVGATVTLHSRFDAEAWFDAVERERPSLTLLVPAVMSALIRHPRWAEADLSSLRAVAAGSSDLPARAVQAFLARGMPVQNVYGATETAPIAIAQDERDALAAPGALGFPAPLTEAVAVDAEGRAVAPGVAGEIAVRGPNVMLGYWRDGAVDASALADGWFRTGDTAMRDEAGRFHHVGRLNNVIISGGENVYPAEVERVLVDAPGIAEGAVCGVPHPQWGEVPVAVVVPGEGYDPEAVLRHFEGKLARYKQPHHVVTVTDLPRTALGKVDLPALRALAVS
ncbi:class I adenylate-forming enzyme family protein [Roseomonas sp. CCTCC AB2023176]|uniref:class I adenylate-forming enzyme family protein n=1 Tax=Roseomonas sp. CCTCC AB2023176 TaxID=3342640 RepID=UPI0035E3A1D9